MNRKYLGHNYSVLVLNEVHHRIPFILGKSWQVMILCLKWTTFNNCWLLYISNTEPKLVRICPKWMVFYDVPHSILIQNNCAIGTSCSYAIDQKTAIVLKKVSTFLPQQLFTVVHLNHCTRTCLIFFKMNNPVDRTSVNINKEYLPLSNSFSLKSIYLPL